MPDPAVTASGLGKSYRLYDRPFHRLVEAVSGRRRHRAFQALEGVSFSLPRGEGLGVIGENGAGKSTLLKILTGITRPTEGSYAVSGKVAAILELGAGFHPEFTGRQNAVLNAALLGLSAAEVDRALPRILEFSELGAFIDRPVKTYSTGMTMRLAFSIATQIEPEILIVDEALSVGDGYFQKKCLDRMLGFIRDGGTVLFCSHAMYYVTGLCQHALWLKDGRVERYGPALEVVGAYESWLLEKGGGDRQESTAAPEARPTKGGMPARIVAVDQGEGPEAGPRRLRSGDPWHLDVLWESADPSRRFHVGVGVDRADGVQVCSFSTRHDGREAISGAKRHRLRLRVPALPIVKGELTIYVFLLDEEGLHVYDQRILDRGLVVESPSYRIGLVAVDHEWEAPAGAEAAAPRFLGAKT